MIVIETERLHLRLLTEQDASFVYHLYNSPGFLNFIGDKGLRCELDAANYLHDKLIPSYINQGFGLYCVERKRDACLLGVCGLVQRDFLDGVDLGYGFLPQFYGEGYAHESSLAVVKYARQRLKLANLLAITQSNNVASIKLLKKLGFEFIKVQDILSTSINLELYQLPLIDINKGLGSVKS